MAQLLELFQLLGEGAAQTMQMAGEAAFIGGEVAVDAEQATEAANEALAEFEPWQEMADEPGYESNPVTKLINYYGMTMLPSGDPYIANAFEAYSTPLYLMGALAQRGESQHPFTAAQNQPLSSGSHQPMAGQKSTGATARSGGKQPPNPARMAFRPASRANPPKPDRAVMRPKNLVSAPNAVSVVSSGNAPRYETSAGGIVTVSHREYVGDVANIGTGAFNVPSNGNLTVQPGTLTPFAWLRFLASVHAQYRFRRLRLVYESQVSTTTPGLIMLAYTPDPDDGAPSSKLTMTQYARNVSGPVWMPLSLTAIDEKSLGKWLYTRAGSEPSDLRLTDNGTLFLAFQGVTTAGLTCGSVYLEYTIDLKSPQLQTGALALASSFRGNYSTLTFPALPFGTVTNTSFGGLPVRASGNLFNLPVGKWLVSLASSGTVMTDFTTATVTVFGGSTVNQVTGGFAGNHNTAGTTNSISVTIVVADPDTPFVYDLTTFATTVTSTSMLVSQYTQN